MDGCSSGSTSADIVFQALDNNMISKVGRCFIKSWKSTKIMTDNNIELSGKAVLDKVNKESELIEIHFFS